jgi:hypothetical protein
MALPDIFIAGVPATGKSWLGQWLAEKHGYIHIDAERDRGADLEGAGVRNEWNQLISTGRAGTFVKAIRRLPNPVIVNWGFPTRYLYVVSALQAEGLQAWWFHAQRNPARLAYVARERIDPTVLSDPQMADFDRQMDDIEREWLLIASVFGSRVVKGLHKNDWPRKPPELWRDISGQLTSDFRGPRLRKRSFQRGAGPTLACRSDRP